MIKELSIKEKKEIELLINAWYQQWLLTNDPYENVFEYELHKLLPEINVTYSNQTNEYIVI